MMRNLSVLLCVMFVACDTNVQDINTLKNTKLNKNDLSSLSADELGELVSDRVSKAVAQTQELINAGNKRGAPYSAIEGVKKSIEDLADDVSVLIEPVSNMAESAVKNLAIEQLASANNITAVNQIMSQADADEVEPAQKSVFSRISAIGKSFAQKVKQKAKEIKESVGGFCKLNETDEEINERDVADDSVVQRVVKDINDETQWTDEQNRIFNAFAQALENPVFMESSASWAAQKGRCPGLEQDADTELVIIDNQATELGLQTPDIIEDFSDIPPPPDYLPPPPTDLPPPFPG